MNERGVSSTLSYVLALAIAALLITGLITAGGGFVTTQRETVIREEMAVVGQHIASNVEQADRMVEASENKTNATVQVNQTLPSTVARSQYDVRLDASESQLILTSTSPEKTVRVNVTTNTSLQDSSAGGGTISVRNEGGELVIANA